jgi:DNA-binding transcriptional ArsR family regulator
MALDSPFVRGNLPFVQTYGYAGPVLQALGDPTRQAIVAQLFEGPRSVGELAASLPVSRPAVSQHLRVLKEARVVCDEARGTRRIYRLDPAGAQALRQYYERFWTAALMAFQEHVGSITRQEEEP